MAAEGKIVSSEYNIAPISSSTIMMRRGLVLLLSTTLLQGVACFQVKAGAHAPAARLSKGKGLGGDLKASPGQEQQHRRRDDSAWAATASAGGGEDLVAVTVRESCRNLVDEGALRGFGSSYRSDGKPRPSQEQEGTVSAAMASKPMNVMLQTVAGVSEDGREVVAVVPPGNVSKGTTVHAQAHHVIPRPQGMAWKNAATFLFLSVSCLLPLKRIGVSPETCAGKNFVVTGGQGSIAPFLIEVLSGWGASVTAASTANKASLTKLGASRVVDFRSESFGEVMPTIDVVVDTVGRETDGAIRQLQELRHAKYQSLMPDILGVAVGEGVLFGAGKLTAFTNMIKSDRAVDDAYWLPEEGGMAAAKGAEGVVGASSPGLSEAIVGVKAYLEALAWPKDRDTGLRFGFPARDSSMWEDYDPYNYDEVEAEEEEEEDEGQFAIEEETASQGASAVGDTPRAPRVATAATQKGSGLGRIRGKADMKRQMDTGEGGLVFVSSRSCRVCKALLPYFTRQADKYPKLRLCHFHSSDDPTLSRALGLETVPAFVSFEGGRVRKVTITTDKREIEEILSKLSFTAY